MSAWVSDESSVSMFTFQGKREGKFGCGRQPTTISLSTFVHAMKAVRGSREKIFRAERDSSYKPLDPILV